MAKFQQVMDSLGTQPKSSSSNNKKRKWREIEQLKEKFQLEKELTKNPEIAGFFIGFVLAL